MGIIAFFIVLSISGVIIFYIIFVNSQWNFLLFFISLAISIINGNFFLLGCGHTTLYYLAKKYIDKIQYSSIFYQLLHLTFLKYDLYFVYFVRPSLVPFLASMRLGMLL